MRLSMRLTFSLAAGVALVSLGLALYQADTERRNLRRELDRRALVLAESLEKSAAPLVQADAVRVLQVLIVRFQEHERTSGVAIFDPQGRTLAATPGFTGIEGAEGRALRLAQQPAGGNGAFLRSGGKPMHLVALSIVGDAGALGTLAVLHDAGYIDAQVISLWRRALAGMAAQTLMIVCATLLILRLSLRRPLHRLEKWLSDLRRGAVSEGPELPEEEDFEPLKREAARLATTLTAARAAAEEEARLRDAGESLWTEERLRAFIQSRLGGSRLFVVSNREPYEHVRRGAAVECSVPASGLVTALEPILRASDGTWIAQGTGNADRETVDASRARARSAGASAVHPAPRVGHGGGGKRILLRVRQRGLVAALSHRAYPADIPLAGLGVLSGGQPAVRRCRAGRDRRRDRPDSSGAGLPFRATAENDQGRAAGRAGSDILAHSVAESGGVRHLPVAGGACSMGCWAADLVGFHVQAHCNNFLDTVDRLLESRIDRERFAVNRGGQFTYRAAVPDQRRLSAPMPIRPTAADPSTSNVRNCCGRPAWRRR